MDEELHISEDIINDSDIVISQSQKEGKVTDNFEFQFMINDIQYNHNIYRANITKIANILNTTIHNSDTNENKVENFKIVEKENYSILSPQDNKKLYFIKGSEESN